MAKHLPLEAQVVVVYVDLCSTPKGKYSFYKNAETDTSSGINRTNLIKYSPDSVKDYTWVKGMIHKIKHYIRRELWMF